MANLLIVPWLHTNGPDESESNKKANDIGLEQATRARLRLFLNFLSFLTLWELKVSPFGRRPVSVPGSAGGEWVVDPDRVEFGWFRYRVFLIALESAEPGIDIQKHTGFNLFNLNLILEVEEAKESHFQHRFLNGMIKRRREKITRNYEIGLVRV